MTFRMAAIQMTSTACVEKNLALAGQLIASAAQRGAQLVVLPEMFAVMGIDQMDKVNLSEPFGEGPIQSFLAHQARQYQLWLVSGTIPLAVENDKGKVHAACLIYDEQGRVAARYDKMHLFDVTLQATGECYQESRTTVPGNDLTVVSTPFGKLGLAVCYDIRFPELFRLMHAQEVEVVLFPAAFTYATGVLHWDILVRARAIENQIYIVAAAQTGIHENGRRTFGHSMIVDPWGTVVASLAEGSGVVIAEIDLHHLHKIRREFPVLSHRR